MLSKVISTVFLVFLISFSSNISARYNSNDYTVWGSLSSGGVKSKINYPKGYFGLSKSTKINPSSYGYPIYFSVKLKTSNVVNMSKLWMRLDDVNGNQVALKNGNVIKGNNGWSTYTVQIDNVPRTAKFVVFGVYLKGSGKVEVRDYRLQ